jgi:hypothetical protein
MNLGVYFFHIYHLDFHLKKIPCHKTLRRFFEVISFSRNILIELIIFESQDDFCFLWDLGLCMLTTQPSNSCTLPYCGPIHLISIEIQNIENNLGILPKNFFYPFNCYNFAIRPCTLSKIFSTNYWDSMLEDLTVESRQRLFHFNHYPTYQYVHGCTCLIPNIH